MVIDLVWAILISYINRYVIQQRKAKRRRDYQKAILDECVGGRVNL